MKTDPHTPRVGFTLIEVLVALVLLAVGLLGLQGLTVAAVRATALGERNSRAAMVATEYLETALEQINLGQTPAQLCVTVDGDRISRAVDIAAPNSATRPRITVVVEPRGAPPRPYRVSTYAFSRAGLTQPGGAPCA